MTVNLQTRFEKNAAYAMPELVERSAAPAKLDGSIADRLRSAMRRHAAGVCVLSSGLGDARTGMVVTSVTSLSMDPPSVLVCINTSASVWSVVQATEQFTLALLAFEDDAIVSRFCGSPSGPARFAPESWVDDLTRPAHLRDAPANLLCRLDGVLHYGSHVVAIGRVEHVVLGSKQTAMVYRDGVYAPFGGA